MTAVSELNRAGAGALGLLLLETWDDANAFSTYRETKIADRLLPLSADCTAVSRKYRR